MKKAISFLEKINEKTGNLVSWVAVLMVIVISLDVIIRYLFQFTFIWIVEIEIYLFGIMFLLAAGYTFKYGKHVKVDVFYAKLSEKGRAWIDLIGGLFFLLPWSYIVISASWRYAYSSFLMGESSPQPGGLPALYILKFCITLGFAFLLLQGLASILKSIQIIFYTKK